MKFSDTIQNDIALDRQIRSVLNSYFKTVIEKSDSYNFRCNVCGDSTKSRTKKRGYILKRKKPWMYFCHNCQYEKPVIYWLKDFFPAYYKLYLKEILQDRKKPKKNVQKIIQPKKENIITDEEKADVKFFKNILKGKGKLFDIAKSFCIERKIPKEVWSKWLVATDGKYKNRLIIPFFNNNGEVYYYQGRSLFNYMNPKYLSRKGKYNSIYNFYNIDKKSPVIILEGMIDSIFVENAIAMTGIKTDIDEDFEKWFLLDYDKTGIKKSLKMIKEGKTVFLWRKFDKEYNLPKRDKWDINDLILYLKKDRFSIKELKPYFSNSIYDKVWLC